MHARPRFCAVLAALGCLASTGARAWAQPTHHDEQPPRVVHLVEAPYPAEALRRHEGATVHLEIDVDDGGHVTTARVVASSGQAEFDEAAVAAARAFEFEPARRDGRAVPARIRYRYRFTPPSERAADEGSPAPVASTARRPAPHATAQPAARVTAEPEEQSATVYAPPPTREMTRRELTQEEIRRLPGTRGDPLLAVQDLPGVARPAFGLGQFVVRSSPPEDTLVLLEGQPIGLPFHFYGLASTISTDLIDRVEFLPGNFSARYGRVAGGVVNVTLAAPRRDRVHFDVDLDVIDLGAFASVPLGRNASVAVGVRRSLIDLLGPPAYALVTGASPSSQFRQWPAYYDAQVVLDWDPTPRDSVRVIAAASDDQLILNFADPNANDPSIRGSIGTHIAYDGVQARWRHRFSPDALHTFAPSIGYNLNSGNIGPAENFTFRSVIVSVRDELELHVTRQARLFLGIDAQGGWLDNTVQAPPLSTNGITDPINASTLVRYADQRPYASPAAYAETEIDASSAVRILAGVRADYYTQLHAATVDPRAMVRIAVTPRFVLRAGVGEYGTPPRGYSIIRGFGNPALQPERWLHMTVGATMDLIPGVLDFDTDVFVKLGDHVVAPSAAFTSDASGNVVPLHFENTGQGRVIGAEWYVRLRPGRASPVYGMLSYTLQRAVRSTCPSCPMLTYTYDQPHILTAVLGATLPFGWEAGVRARYTSGFPEPTVTGALYDADHDVSLTLTNPLVSGRLPDFFALDVRVAKRFRLGPLRCQGILEVLNVTNNYNAESRLYSYDRRTSALIYGLPILPSLGIRAEY